MPDENTNIEEVEEQEVEVGKAPEESSNASEEPSSKNKADNEQEDIASFSKEQQETINKIVADRVSRATAKAEEKREEAARLAEMNAQQRTEYELDKLKKERDELMAEKQRYNLAREASKMLQSKGLTASDEILNVIVKDTAEDTQSAVNGFVEMVQAEAEKLTKQRYSGKPPKKLNSSGKAYTKEEIMDIEDSQKRQKLIAENLHLFKEE